MGEEIRGASEIKDVADGQVGGRARNATGPIRRQPPPPPPEPAAPGPGLL